MKMTEAPSAAAVEAMDTAAVNNEDPYQSIAFQEALDDVDSRFILNLPDSELATADRIFIQLEQAWWFYEDMLCDPRPELDLPRYPNFKPFARALFEYSPRLPHISQFDKMWNQYIQYKRKIANYGCILLNANCSQIVLCQVYNGRSYTLPAGKINQGEDGPAAAARETYEETGFDPSCRAGLSAEWKESSPQAITWNTTFLEHDLLSIEDHGKHRACYVIAGVPIDFPFAPVCRKEVAAVEWFTLDNLPTSTFAVLPFIRPLRDWIRQHKEHNKKDSGNKSRERGKKSNQTTSSSKRQGSRGRNDSSRGRVVQSGGDNDDLIASGLAQAGDLSGWSEEDMFTTNERILSRKVEYDGNPHVFVEEALSRTDPHAFRIVGGAFLNSNPSDGIGIAGLLAPPPDQSQLQPIFRSNDQPSKVEGLTPFFTEDGATPWGEVIPEAKVERTKRDESGKKGKARRQNPARRAIAPLADVQSDNDTIKDTRLVQDLLPTDAQITAQSQSAKLPSKQSALSLQHQRNMEFIQEWAAKLPRPMKGITLMDPPFRLDTEAICIHVEVSDQVRRETEQERRGATTVVPQSDEDFIRQWMAKLPKPAPTKRFGVFQLDADAIMTRAEGCSSDR
jgi:mRNA-decapping enzyme subunit 2